MVIAAFLQIGGTGKELSGWFSPWLRSPQSPPAPKTGATLG
jgi:hypothetical protein